MDTPKLNPQINEQLKHVPVTPGVYLWKGANDHVLYVGKSKELRKRMRQYVTGHDGREWIDRMMTEVVSFDYVVTSSEVEALMMEITLIKQLSPPYNVAFRDNKSYPYIALTMGDKYPSIKYTREKKRTGTRYFGPYTDARGARETVDTLRRVIPLCRSTCPEYRQVQRSDFTKPVPRPCFDSQLGYGPGVCSLSISPEDYALHVKGAISLLEGDSLALERDLQQQMESAATDLNYELAARMRNRLEGLQSIKKRQAVVSDSNASYDVLGFAREETIAAAYVLIVREGKVLYGNDFILDKGFDVNFENLASSFIGRYYSDAGQIPAEVICEIDLRDKKALETFLSQRRREASDNPHAGKVRLMRPERGTKKKLLVLAQRNAKHALLRFKVRTHYDTERLNSALLQLESALSLESPPLRIESFDISTLQGAHSVGSMVVFTNGKIDKAAYRRFKIKGDFDQANDVAMMGEVLSRRFSPERRKDERFGRIPDLLLIDGGKPQLNAVAAVLDELGVEDVALAGLAKREEELWTTWSEDPIVLRDGSPSLYLVKRIRDEAHRFALDYHRKLRDKAMTASILDEVPGIGPKRRKALIRHFGSFKKIKEASREELETAPGITEQVAQDLYAMLHVTFS
ncbi:MAG: excinuclease ABC subunit UvrC [Coriobacteriia bacterium]|nr:excinuclease ABC subunit UvrC [Coriobacteriia bacterium]MCL2870108.1 excinuclease ABC subunit UvrC [Coriobacteriia bacterium]